MKNHISLQIANYALRRQTLHTGKRIYTFMAMGFGNNPVEYKVPIY